VQLYAVGLVGYSIVKILSPAFYALGRSRTPAAVGVAAVLLNAVLSVVTARSFGYRGIALSASIAALFNAALLLWLLRRALGGLELWRVLSSFVKTIAASLAMAATAWWVEQWLTSVLPGASLAAQAARLGGSIAAGLIVLGTGAYLLRLREFQEVQAAVMARLRRIGRRA
jgi:putative peptidoglycan lipid II flippase